MNCSIYFRDEATNAWIDYPVKSAVMSDFFANFAPEMHLLCRDIPWWGITPPLPFINQAHYSAVHTVDCRVAHRCKVDAGGLD